MLYDLNIAWSPATTTEQLLQTLSSASSLGYATVALNHTLELPLPANPTKPFPPLPTTEAASASSAPRSPTVLYRATFPLADPAASNYRLPSLVSVYDLLAVRPLTDWAFQNACLTLDVPLISLDLTQHFPFHFRPKPCMAAVTRGVRFEICYSQALAADPRGRANFIGNATNLIRATRGRGIILSSEAKTALGLRAPADVVNLLNVWGLPTETAMEGLRSIPRSVVVNEGIKRNGFRGVIEIVQVAKKSEKETAEEQEEASAAEQAARKKGKNQKRKTGEGDDAQPMSKRQAKKMKLAARNAAPVKKGS